MATKYDSESLRLKSLRYLWMHNRDWVQMAEDGEPMIAMEGQGVRIIDSEGKSWIDVNGGYNSVNVGYGRQEIVDAAYEQMMNLAYYPAGTVNVPAVQLAEKLASLTPGSLNRVFPVSGGSEANETALKIARAYHKRRGDSGRYKVISRRGSYHGTTAGVLWLGGVSPSIREDFDPMYPGMVYAPQPNPYHCELGGETPSECAVRCAEAIETLIRSHGPETVAAVIAEPISAASGAAVPGDEYWPMLRDICDRYGVLLIADEVITGFGRTGETFAVEHWDVVPDIMTVAKGIISSYLPLAATIVKSEVADAFAGGDNYLRHALTFSGHPVSAAASLRNIEIIEQEGMVENARDVGAYLKEQLDGLSGDHPIIGDVRGIGLLAALEVVQDRDTKTHFLAEAEIPKRLNERFKKYGLILRTSNPIISIGPPICITRSEVDEIVHGLDLSLWELEGELGIAQLA
ncbi:MAG: aspartate aminotransferase family protein [SAR202 cluster bacterium]|nr:aspartate aminotransferase family protein [SAR202 cluster bacterium]